MRRMEKGRQVIFFREEPGAILLCQILYQACFPENTSSRTAETCRVAAYKSLSLLCDLPYTK